MPWTADTFKAALPEFEPTDDYVVSDALAEAVQEVKTAVFGKKTDVAVKWLAAHLIALRPGSEHARLKKDQSMTIYYHRYEAILNQVAHGHLIIL
jgi:hypothetical protein